MVNSVNNIGIVILAAGKGKRMNGHENGPKALVPLLGRPLIAHLLEHIKESVIQTKPVIVIAPDLYVIRDTIGSSCEYAIQESQLGTGHAVLSAKDKLMKYEHVLVLYGDHPLVTKRTIDLLVSTHRQQNADMTMAVVQGPHFREEFAPFDQFGRIMRDASGRIVKSIERPDATPDEQAITEVNPCFYVFRASMLWGMLPKLSRDNAQKEYYLPDVLEAALRDGLRVADVVLPDPREALGVNTPEQLELVERIMSEQLEEGAKQRIAKLPL